MIRRILHQGTLRRVLRQPHELRDYITQDGDLFVLAHLGVPEIDPSRWAIDLDGAFGRPGRLTLDDLRHFPRHDVVSVHKCAGNPLKAHLPTPERAGNVVWSGARLADVLAHARIGEDATHVWADGCDAGVFEGHEFLHYRKDLPRTKAMSAEVLLAYEMNGAPLTPERGGPVRLVVPGWYGTNSVKWLVRLRAARGRADSAFTTLWYNDQGSRAEGVDDPGAQPQDLVPVWGLAPEAVVVEPHGRVVADAGDALAVRGWAWGEQPIRAVDISSDDGRTWLAAEVEARDGFGWQRFAGSLRAGAPGPMRILARATDTTGLTQPLRGARNAAVAVTIALDPPGPAEPA